MYISVYDENSKHLTNIDNILYDLTTRVYDEDSFSATGTSELDINNACYIILNDELGNYQYSCFCNGITSEDENNQRKIKGQDFKVLFNTEILLNYTKENSFTGILYDILSDITNLIFATKDKTIQKLKVIVNIPESTKKINTTELFGSLQDTYKIVNAYSFLKGYLKYYEYNLNSKFDETTSSIIFSFVKNNDSISINLRDFTHSLETNSNEINKTVATIKFEPISKDNSGNEVVNERPNTIATKYYYRTKDNQIVESDEYGDIENRIYPVFSKIFEQEYLADAQYDAIYELADARYVDNVILDNNSIIDPIDLSNYNLYTKFNLYYNNKFYKTLPLSEKSIKFDSSGKSTTIKLGFKKIYLTEIIKAQGGKQ